MSAETQSTCQRPCARGALPIDGKPLDRRLAVACENACSDELPRGFSRSAQTAWLTPALKTAVASADAMAGLATVDAVAFGTIEQEIASQLWVTPGIGKWSHRLRSTLTREAAFGVRRRVWYSTLCGQTVTNDRPRGRPAFVSEERRRPECPVCAKRAASQSQ